MKIIVIGTSLSGKTALVRYLRAHTDLIVEEIDEELTQRNGGQYPLDVTYKTAVLVPKIIQDVLAREKIIFFVNTDYFTLDDLKKARKLGFKIIQLDVDLEVLKKRNAHRVKYEGYGDLSPWLEGMVQYQRMIKERGLVDLTVNADTEID